MRVLSLFTALSFIAFNLMAQSVSWQKSFVCENLTQGHSVSSNENFCFVLSEVSIGPYGQSDLVVTKRNLFGEIIWNRVIGSSRIESGMNAVIELLSDESIFIIGFSKQDTLDDRDVFCCKLSSEGDVIWSKTIPFLNGNEVPRDIIELINGDLLIVGSIVSQSFGSNDGFISRIDTAGNVIWAKNIGGSQNDHFYSVKEMSDCILVAGNCQSLDGVHHPWLLKLSLNGLILNEKVYSYQSTELFMSIAVDSNHIYATGYTTDSYGDRHMWISSFTSNLEIEWCTYATQISEGVDINLSNNIIIVVGNSHESTLSSVLISKFDLEGNLLASFSTSSYSDNFVSPVSSVSQVQDNELLILNTNISDEQTSVHLSKLDIGSLSSCSFEGVSMQFDYCELLAQELSSNIQSLGNMINYSIESEIFEFYYDFFICPIECEFELNFPSTICTNEYFGVDFSNSISSDYFWSYNGNYILNHDSVLIQSSWGEQLAVNLIVNSQIESCGLDTTIFIDVLSPPVNLFVDTTLCTNSSLTNAVDQVIGEEYSWDLESEFLSEDTDSSYVFLGTYFNSCGSADFNVSINVLDENVIVTLPEYSCDTIIFNLTDSYTWASGNELTSENVILPHNQFNDTLIFAGSGCYFEIPLTVEMPETIPNQFSVEEIFCRDSVDLFITEIETLFEINYLDGTFLDEGVYEALFIFENECGSELIDWVLITEDCHCSKKNSFIPNAFSPNYDNLNDVFEIVSVCDFLSFQLSIYNRFGECIFQTNDPHQPWTGNVHNGEHYAPDGIYTWQLTTSTAQHPPALQTGHVTLLR